ncbi:MAG: holo-ACP synthase [Aphanocapsa lilacina HA4352-LM1]|jgi:holo-[acyl-carrier protein] synthase|nr:holo-ACP synthase [Aphanocapsa lilacina HA4352-LM1]
MSSICFATTRLRTGIDIIYNADVLDLVDAPPGVLLSEDEWRELRAYTEPLEHLAGKFACKEAVLKAMGCGLGEVELSDIEISKDKLGKPFVALHGSAVEYWRRTGCTQLSVSISHHRDYSVAVAVAA